MLRNSLFEHFDDLQSCWNFFQFLWCQNSFQEIKHLLSEFYTDDQIDKFINRFAHHIYHYTSLLIVCQWIKRATRAKEKKNYEVYLNQFFFISIKLSSNNASLIFFVN